MTSSQLQSWMKKSSLNKSNTAKALGISRPTLNNYLSGLSRIPKYIELACRALTGEGR